MKRMRERSVRDIQNRRVFVLAALACVLYLLSGCASRMPYPMGSLDGLWVKERGKLIHPDKTVIRFEKPRSHRGRLTEKNKEDFYHAVTPSKLLTSWGVNDPGAVILRFSKKWEPWESSGNVHRFVMEMDCIVLSSPLGYEPGEKITTKRVILYRYRGANVTERTGIGIMGYTDRVAAHSDAFNDLVTGVSRGAKRL
jgi:hypothetical protein